MRNNSLLGGMWTLQSGRSLSQCFAKGSQEVQLGIVGNEFSLIIGMPHKRF